jgi:hypothetical protein
MASVSHFHYPILLTSSSALAPGQVRDHRLVSWSWQQAALAVSAHPRSSVQPQPSNPWESWPGSTHHHDFLRVTEVTVERLPNGTYADGFTITVQNVGATTLFAYDLEIVVIQP